jgi:hypothetical protein
MGEQLTQDLRDDDDYAVNASDGALTATLGTAPPQTPPMSMVVDPAGHFVNVRNYDSDSQGRLTAGRAAVTAPGS